MEGVEMTDTVTAALITVGGMLGVAALSAVTQIKVTKRIINSEYRKIAAQIREESLTRVREKRIEKLHELISALLTMLDPDANKSIDLGKMTTLINKAQLLLDLGVEAEKNLNGAINEIAVFISGYDVNGGVATWLDLGHRAQSLKMQARVIDAAKTLFAHPHR
jgi:hypothetical protein